MTGKTRIAVALCFLAALAAGLAAGFALARLGPPPRRSWLDRELNLTPRQREQMREIWSKVISGPTHQEFRERRQKLEEERRQAILGLLSDETRQKYEEVMKKYDEKIAALEEERQRLLQEAVESTKRILTEQQRKKYTAMLESRAGSPWRRGPPGKEGPFPGGEPPHGPPGGRFPGGGMPPPPPPDRP